MGKIDEKEHGMCIKQEDFEKFQKDIGKFFGGVLKEHIDEDKEAHILIEANFRKMEESFTELHKTISKLFNPKIKVKNGVEKEIALYDVIKDLWENMHRQEALLNKISKVETTDANGSPVKQDIDVFVKGIAKRPERTYNKIANFSDKGLKIGGFFGKAVLMMVGLGYIVQYLIEHLK